MATVAEPDWGVAHAEPQDPTNTVDTGVDAPVEHHIQLWHPPRDPFSGASTTHTDFPGWMPAPKGDKANAAPFGWKINMPTPPRAPTSTFQADFPPKLMDPMEAFATTQNDAKPLASPPAFSGESSYTKNFTQPMITPKELTQAGNAWPGMLAKVPAQTRLFETTTAHDYPAHPILPKIPAPVPDKLPEVEEKKPEVTTVPFEGGSSYHDDYKPCVAFLPVRRWPGSCWWSRGRAH